MTTDKHKLANVRIVGESNIGSGPFDTVKITGNGYAHEELNCRKLKVMGEIKADKSLVCAAASIVGTMKVRGDCAIQQADIIGEVHIEGNWQSDLTDIRGELTIDGQGVAEQIKVRGSLRVKGLFNSDKVEIISAHPSKLQELGGRKIEVRKPRMSLHKPFRKTILEVQSIEADEIDIDYTTAQVVRGSRIKIGKHCQIGKVEYSECLIVEKGSVVETQVKTTP